MSADEMVKLYSVDTKYALFNMNRNLGPLGLPIFQASFSKRPCHFVSLISLHYYAH